MMILDSCPRIIPMAHLTTTLASMRESDIIPGTNIHGINEKLYTWFKINGPLAAEAFLIYLDDVPDFSPKKCKSIQTDESGREVLLDKDEAHVHKFIENLKISFHNHSHDAKSYIQVSKQDQSWTIIGDNDYNETNIGELKVEERDLSATEIEDLKRELPFLLHSVADRVKSFGIHFYSLITAVYTLNINVTKRYYFVNEFVGNVYSVDRYTGGPDKIVQSQTPKLRDCISWVNGDSPDPAYSDFHKLLYTMRALNIDPRKDDLTKINSDFINDIITDYITPNNQIVSRNLGKTVSMSDMIDYNVRQLIYRTSLEEYLSGDFSLDKCLVTLETDASHIIQLVVMDADNFPPNEELSKKFLNMLRNKGLIFVLGSQTAFDDSGFAFNMQTGQRIEVNVSTFCNHATPQEHMAFLHISGNLLLLKDNSNSHRIGEPNYIYYLPYDIARQYICYKKPYISPTKKVYDLGEWDTCYI